MEEETAPLFEGHKDLSKGERTQRYGTLRKSAAFQSDPAAVQQLEDQFSLEADVMYLLAQNRDNFLSDAAWQEAKTKVNALNPGKFTFNGGTPVIPTPDVPFTFVGSPNFWPGELRAGDAVAIIQHTAVGTKAGIRATFGNPASQVSSTGCIMLDGSVDIYVGPFDAAWANGIVESGALPQLIKMFQGVNPNQRTISFEREDGGNPKLPVPDAQVRGTVAAYRWALGFHPEITMVSGHNAISPQSRTCPESAWLDTGLLKEVATAVGLGYLEYA